jgi:hypothetical protein
VRCGGDAGRGLQTEGKARELCLSGLVRPVHSTFISNGSNRSVVREQRARAKALPLMVSLRRVEALC